MKRCSEGEERTGEDKSMEGGEAITPGRPLTSDWRICCFCLADSWSTDGDMGLFCWLYDPPLAADPVPPPPSLLPSAYVLLARPEKEPLLSMLALLGVSSDTPATASETGRSPMLCDMWNDGLELLLLISLCEGGRTKCPGKLNFAEKRGSAEDLLLRGGARSESVPSSQLIERELPRRSPDCADISSSESRVLITEVRV